MTYFIYQSVSQAARPRAQADQREIDRANGELAAALAELSRGVATPVRSLRRALHTGRRRAPMSAPRQPRHREAASELGLVPGTALRGDDARICSVSSSPDRTRQLSRR